MIKKVIALFAVFAALALGQDRDWSGSFSATGTNGLQTNLLGTDIAYHRLSWFPVGTVSTCTVGVQQSANGTTWSDLIAGQTCTSTGRSTWVGGQALNVRVNVSTLSGGGSIHILHQMRTTEFSAPGVITSAASANPAAGAEIVHTVPTGREWSVLVATFQLVTDSTVANRQVRVEVDNGTTTYFQTVLAAAQTASTTEDYSIGEDLAVDHFLGFPEDLRIPAGHRIKTVTTNIQAGDDFGAATFIV